MPGVHDRIHRYKLHNLKKLNDNNNASMDLHEAWSSLIQKVEEENPDWKHNVALTWIKCTLVENTEYNNLFPLNAFSLFGDLPLVYFIIENNMIENLIN